MGHWHQSKALHNVLTFNNLRVSAYCLTSRVLILNLHQVRIKWKVFSHSVVTQWEPG